MSRTQVRNTKSALFFSIVSLFLCFAMLLGTTLAWFTDSVTSTGNKIEAGTLKVDLWHLYKDNWVSLKTETQHKIFNYDKWEPGYTRVETLKVENQGTLALKYMLALEVAYGSPVVGENGENLADVIEVYTSTTEGNETSWSAITASANWTKKGTLADVLKAPTEFLAGELLAQKSQTLRIALHMQETAGNEYQNLSIGNVFVSLVATQLASEDDSFDNTYDQDATLPGFSGSAAVSLLVDVDENGYTKAEATATGEGGVKLTVPAGTKVTGNRLTLNVDKLATTSSNIQLQEGQNLYAYDIHVNGIAEDNTTPVGIYVPELAVPGLNRGNYDLYHVEDGVTNTMTYSSNNDLTVHNNFGYDPATGDVSMGLAGFSEVAVVSEPAKWEGNRDYSWYTNAVAPVDGEATPDYVIANADQLAALSAIVGGMDGQTQDSFKGKTVKLLADINLGDEESKNNPNIIFYPIGYYNSDGTYEKTNKAITSGLRNFEGTFDGNGHTVSNFYQNTWEMKGDHNWYDATLQYYRDGMGLFGRVYGGTVKNLTVKNFSSDGEIATTGVIAAYAEGATFENIAIFNCNPRVYNIGNGGIVGCVGWYAKEANLKTTFTNITVDNSNKISALWGSYDVACGGIVGQYYPTSGQTSAGTPKNAGIDFVNCHIAAQMDVYNDVCANYQYYAYRYTGMLIGSVRENVTINGHSYPDLTGIKATDCTVHFGTWNDYYYCEFEKNGHPSYSGPDDYKFSRIPHSEINFTDSNGNGIIDTEEEKASVTGCKHTHTAAEDQQCVYLEFNNLVTGYGWGVTSRGFSNLEGVTNLGVTESDTEKSVKKFSSSMTTLTTNRVYTLDEIFAYIEDCGVKVIDGAVNVTITNLDEKGNVIATFTRGEKWNEGTISFENTGDIAITIQDYYFCQATTITVNVTERTAEEKFDVVMNNGDFLHRVGNSGTVALDKLFKAKDGVTVGTVSVTVEAVDGTSASGTYSNNAIQFNGTGVVKVTIKDDDTYCTPTVLYLEVVDAKNYSGVNGESLNATSNNVVLLCNIGSGFTVSGEYTFFGNGFTLNYTGDGRYLNNGLKQGLVTVSENGTLDNLHIKASIYPLAFMYYGATTLGDYVQQETNPREVEGEKTRYYYQLSSVVAKGNATVQNCYIYGGRTNVFIDTGDVTIKDSILECGTVANVQIQSTAEYTVTLENVTTIQYQVNATIGDTSKVMLGTGVLVGPDTTSNPTIVLNGYFKQYNWVTQEDYDNVSSEVAKMIIDGALEAIAFNHTVNGKTASNLGIIYMNEAKVNVTNNTGLPYVTGTVSISSAKGQVYSLQGATTEQIYSDYANADRNTVNGDYLPTFEFDLGDQEISYDGSEDTRYLYGDADGVTALYQDGTDVLTLDLSKLATIYKYIGKNYTYTAVCKNSSGNTLSATNNVVTLSAQGDYTLEFTVTDNIFYDKNGQTITKSVTRTYTVPLKLTVKAADVKNATVNITKTALDGVYNTVNFSDYELRIKFLDCISVTDYDNKGTGSTVNLSSNIASATLTPSGVNVFTTAFTVTITYTDGRVLTVNFSKISGSSPGTKTGKINTSGSVYFTTEGALNNKPTEASSQNKCTITSVSYKGNSGSTVTNDTDVTVTWALGSSSGCFAAGTLITLADGTQKPIEEITYADELLAWDFNTGAYAVTVPSLIESHEAAEFRVINLKFADGTVARIIVDHGFFDVEANNFVFINEENVSNYVGHSFVKAGENGTYETTELVGYEITVEVVAYYSIQTAIYNNCIAENMFTLPSAPELLDTDKWFDYFEIGEGMKYDEEKMQADIEKYGLYTYEDFAEYVTYEQFIAFNGPYLKVLVGKGIVTYDEIIQLISIYVNPAN